MLLPGNMCGNFIALFQHVIEKRNQMKYFLSLFIVMFFVSGCQMQTKQSDPAVSEQTHIENLYPDVQNIIDITWRWQQTIYNNDTKAIPSSPKQYTLQLLPDGNVNIRADCNVGGGTYSLKDRRISLEITHTTMAACPPESLEDVYIKDLNAATILFMVDENMYIDLMYDTGTMKFSK